MMVPRQDERGAALLTVLLLVAVLSVIAATAFDRLSLATRQAAGAAAADQARLHVLAAEQLAMRRVAGLQGADTARTPLHGGWPGRAFTLPLPDGGQAALRLSDGGNCFNLNSLAMRDDAGNRVAQPRLVAQFAALMQQLGIASDVAARVAATSADRIDSDLVPLPAGQEDGGGTLAANQPFATADELATLPGLAPRDRARLVPFVCALPTDQPSAINVNTLAPEQAALVAMLAPDTLSPARARAILASRPAGGYPSTLDFWAQPALASVRPAEDQARQAVVRTRWFQLESDVKLGDMNLAAHSLIDTGDDGSAPPVVVRREWPAS